MYEVIRRFSDRTDNNYVYEIGDTFPREGVTASKERITELSGSENALNAPAIKKQEKQKK